jgi:hypothetical protein
MLFDLPPNLRPEDESRHAAPKAAKDALWGDTLWVSVVDPKANIFGINHFHLTSKGFARFEALYLIDGVPQLYGNKAPLRRKTDSGPWSDGRLSYEVLEPFERLRIAFDGPRYAFDLDFRGRFAPFDYHDSVRGDPLANATIIKAHGGHYEQGMSCQGTFEIRGGPAAGETRQIDCWSHRDHTWSDRFTPEPPWQFEELHTQGHYWPSIQLPDRHINIYGRYLQNEAPEEEKWIGGFVSTKDGSRPILSGKGQIVPSEGEKMRQATGFSYELTLPDREIIHVRSTAHYGTVKLWDRAENDLENRLDCYEAFVDWEVEETGEVGTGVAEYSVQPPLPQWLV